MSRRIIYLLILLSLINSRAIASSDSNTITSKPVKLVGLTEDSHLEDTSTKELQSLLNRVEILEHTVSKLESRLEALDKISTEVTPKTVVETPTNDIFDLPNAPSKHEARSPLATPPSKEATSPAKPSGDKNAYDLALAALKDNKFDEAEAKFADFLKNYPKSNLQSNAYFWYGETFFRRNIYDKAAINYLKGYKEFPKGLKAADSLLKLALSLNEINKKKDACSTLEKLEAEFPDRPASSIKRAKDAKVKFGCK